MAHIIDNGKPTKSKKRAKTRMDICKECDSYNSKFKLCNECACFMPAKVLLKESFCPLLKWGPE
jgi:hypothetical protein